MPNSDLEASSTPTTIAVDANAPQEEVAREPLPIRGSIFSFQQGLSADSLNPNARLTYNPSYYWSFFLQLRYYLDPQMFLVLSESTAIEWTDSDSSTIEREFQFSDPVLELRRTESFEGYVFIPSIRVALPLSVSSQAADRIVNLGASLTAVKVFPELANLTLALFLTYRRWFALTNVPTTTPTLGGSPSAYSCSQGDFSSATCDQVSGQTTERDRISWAFTVNLAPAEGLTLTMQYAYAWIYGHELAAAPSNAIGGPRTIVDASPSHWRDLHYWTLLVAYDVVPWLNLSLGYQSASSFAPVFLANGDVRNPLYNDASELSLTATLSIEGLVDALTDQPDNLTPEERQRRRQGLARADSRPRF